MPKLWQVMGILNVTPDSFHDGGKYFGSSANAALNRVEQMVAEGAEIIDIGGESSRPGAPAVSVEEEMARVIPVVAAVRKHYAPLTISIDTTKPAVARAALEAGANIINDISGFQQMAMAALLKEYKCRGVLMHMQGTPQTMQLNPTYGDVVAEVRTYFENRLLSLQEIGVARAQLILDPGIGFGKTVEHNLQLLRSLHEFAAIGCPLLIGTSHKSFIGKILGDNNAARLEGSLASAVLGLEQGVRIFRVHDVGPTVRALHVAQAIVTAP